MDSPRDHAEVVRESDVPEMAADAEVDAPGAAAVEVDPALRRIGAVAPSAGSRRVRPLEPQAPRRTVATQVSVMMVVTVREWRNRWGDDIDAETTRIEPR